MTQHTTGTAEDHLEARLALLEAEKEHTRRGDELARQRWALPWVPVEKEYAFDTDAGEKTLPELFDGRSQLLVYHFMFGPRWSEGCPVCSFWADSFNGAVTHLAHHDVTMLCASRAPLAQLDAYKRRMGWSFPWVSSGGNDFNYDFGVSVRDLDAGDSQPQMERPGPDRTDLPAYNFTKKAFIPELPGLSAFAVQNGVVYPNILVLCAGPGRVQHCLSAARSRARRPGRSSPAAHLDSPPRSVRGLRRRGGGRMTRSGSPKAQAAVAFGLLTAAGLAWWSTAVPMQGMNAAPGTDLGTVGWFTVTWAVMMAAMMLPALAPAASTAVGRVRVASRTVLFAGGYSFVWTLAGVAVYGVLAVASHAAGLAWASAGRWLSASVLMSAAVYELTPIKRTFLTRCRRPPVKAPGSDRYSAIVEGMSAGLCCLGCSWALMAAVRARRDEPHLDGARRSVRGVRKLGPWPRAGIAVAAAVLTARTARSRSAGRPSARRALPLS